MKFDIPYCCVTIHIHSTLSTTYECISFNSFFFNLWSLASCLLVTIVNQLPSDATDNKMSSSTSKASWVISDLQGTRWTSSTLCGHLLSLFETLSICGISAWGGVKGKIIPSISALIYHSANFILIQISTHNWYSWL